MDFLVEGYKKFREGFYKLNKDIYEGLSEGQHPKALFITCVDSRINPSLIFNINPGDLLILRNPGNVVYAYDDEIDYSVAATVEFAVYKLSVRWIFVCGHSDCGAMRALFQEKDFFKNTPKLHEWVESNSKIRNIALDNSIEKSSDFFRKVEYQNLINSLNNLKEYPFIKELLKRNEIQIKGLYFDIKSAHVFIFDEEKNDFIIID